MTTKYDLQRQLDFTEARELALIMYLREKAPDKVSGANDVLNGYYTRIFAAGNNKQSSDCTVPTEQAKDIEDALRLDGCDSFNITVYSSNAWNNTPIEYIAYYVWYEGVMRFYKEFPITIWVNLAPAGTLDES